MKTKYKIAFLVINIVIASVFLSNISSAAKVEEDRLSLVEINNNKVCEMKNQLEEKYQITIDYPSAHDGEEVIGITPETLKTLDMTLEYITPYLVQKVSEFNYNLNGRRLKYRYSFAKLDMQEFLNCGQVLTIGEFDMNKGEIKLFIPYPKTQAIISGDTPITIIHEFAHALWMMIEADENGSGIKEDFEKLNSIYCYSPNDFVQNPDPNVFITGYASTSFFEDFAETFTVAISRKYQGNRSGNRFIVNGRYTNLEKKIILIEGAVGEVIPKSNTFR